MKEKKNRDRFIVHERSPPQTDSPSAAPSIWTKSPGPRDRGAARRPPRTPPPHMHRELAGPGAGAGARVWASRRSRASC